MKPAPRSPWAVGCASILSASVLCAGAARPAAPEDGLRPTSACARQIFHISPDGHRASAVFRPEGRFTADIVSWDLQAKQTRHFQVADIDGQSNLSPAAMRAGAMSLALDGDTIALRAISVEAKRSFRLIDSGTGEDRGQAPFVADRPDLPYHVADNRALGAWVAMAWPDAAQRIVSVNLRTGAVQDWRAPADGGAAETRSWWIDATGLPRLRIVRDDDGARRLETRTASGGWRILTELGDRAIDVAPPVDFSPHDMSAPVVSDLGRNALAAGMLDLTTGEIAYFRPADDARRTLAAQWSADGRELLWETVAGGDTVFASDRAETLYRRLVGEKRSVEVMEWSADGGVALVRSDGLVEAVSVRDGADAAERTVLCDGSQPSELARQILFPHPRQPMTGDLFLPQDFDGKRFVVHLPAPGEPAAVRVDPRVTRYLRLGYGVLSVGYGRPPGGRVAAEQSRTDGEPGRLVEGAAAAARWLREDWRPDASGPQRSAPRAATGPGFVVTSAAAPPADPPVARAEGALTRILVAADGASGEAAHRAAAAAPDLFAGTILIDADGDPVLPHALSQKIQEPKAGEHAGRRMPVTD